MSGWLIELDKQPGVRPVGVGETLRRLMEKYLIWVMGKEEKAACGMEQLAIGVEAGIKSSIRKRTGGFSSLIRVMNSMRRTGHGCFGMSGMSGLVARTSP